MLKRPHYIALTLMVLFTGVLLNLSERAASQIKLAVSHFFLPLFGVAGSAHHLTERALNQIAPRSTLLQQLDQLRLTNEILRARAVQGEEILRENHRLRDLVGWQRQAPWPLKLARVVGRDPANWWRSLHIDLGQRDGIITNLTVRTAEGLVGRVSQVGYNRSHVVLVGDPHCRVSVMVQETGETTGIIGPSETELLDNQFAFLTYLPRNSNVKPGHKVLTSGQGGVFAKGIPVGEIIDTEIAENGLYLSARVRLAADFNRLETVWVILP